MGKIRGADKRGMQRLAHLREQERKGGREGRREGERERERERKERERERGALERESQNGGGEREREGGDVRVCELNRFCSSIEAENININTSTHLAWRARRAHLLYFATTCLSHTPHTHSPSR